MKRCTFCEKPAVADVTIPGATREVYVCQEHLEHVKLYWEKEKKEYKPRTLPTVAGKEFTRVKLTKEMEEYLDKSYTSRQEGIRRIVKAHMVQTKPMKDPVSEEIRRFLIRLYAEKNGVIDSFTDIMKAIGKSFHMEEADVGRHLNNLMREEYLWREEDKWKISETKRMFSGEEEFIREVVHIKKQLRDVFGSR